MLTAHCWQFRRLISFPSITRIPIDILDGESIFKEIIRWSVMDCYLVTSFCCVIQPLQSNGVGE